jgi:isopenicillin N synthase-like dioxygenase
MKNFNSIEEAEKYARQFFAQNFDYYQEIKQTNNKGIIEFYYNEDGYKLQCTIFASEPLKRPVGRPKGPEKLYIGFKIEPKYHAEVKAMVKEFIRIQNSLLTLNKQ